MIVRDFPRIVTLHFLRNNLGEIPYYHIGLFADFENYCIDIMEESFGKLTRVHPFSEDRCKGSSLTKFGIIYNLQFIYLKNLLFGSR